MQSGIVCKSSFLILTKCGRRNNKITKKQKRSSSLAVLATLVRTVLVKTKIPIQNKTKHKIDNKIKNIVINKLVKRLWYGVESALPARLWASRTPGDLLSVRSSKQEGKVLKTNG